MDDQVNACENFQDLLAEQAMRVGNNAYGFHGRQSFNFLRNSLGNGGKNCKEKKRAILRGGRLGGLGDIGSFSICRQPVMKMFARD